MPKVKVYNQKGEIVGEEKLNPEIFDVDIKPEIVHRAVVAQAACARAPIASTKDRGEVRGGGAKPWRQKGTGRARAGSIRSPIWRGGGITFGPRPEKNFSQKINKKEKRKALFMALTSKIKEGHLVLLDNLKLLRIKTKAMREILSKLSIKEENVLIVLPSFDLKISKSAANLPKAKVMLANSLSVIDVLKHDYLLILRNSLKLIEKTFYKTT